MTPLTSVTPTRRGANGNITCSSMDGWRSCLHCHPTGDFALLLLVNIFWFCCCTLPSALAWLTHSWVALILPTPLTTILSGGGRQGKIKKKPKQTTRKWKYLIRISKDYLPQHPSPAKLIVNLAQKRASFYGNELLVCHECKFLAGAEEM